HAIANALIHRLPIELAARPRVAVERRRPPVDDPLALRAGQRALLFEEPVEHLRGRPVGRVEIQRLAEPDSKLDPLARDEPFGIDSAEPLAGTGEVVGRGAFTEPCE